ncbi:unnamed protein product [Chrysoparadoxa australica]
MAAVEIAATDISDVEYRKLTSKPLVKSTDMSQEMCQEAVELVTMAVDKFVASKNFEAASQLIKNSLDKRFGASWHCAIGEGFGFEVTHQQRNMLFVFFGQVKQWWVYCATNASKPPVKCKQRRDRRKSRSLVLL